MADLLDTGFDTSHLLSVPFCIGPAPRRGRPESVAFDLSNHNRLVSVLSMKMFPCLTVFCTRFSENHAVYTPSSEKNVIYSSQMTPGRDLCEAGTAACAAQNGSASRPPRPGGQPLPYALRRQAARQVLDEYRAALRAGALSAVPGLDELEQSVLRRGAELARPALGRVINATGVVLHTNLGRAPLSPRAAAAVGEAARGYSNLEYDLSARRRGRRGRPSSPSCAPLTGAGGGPGGQQQRRRRVSPPSPPWRRAGGGHLPGELVEIGGGFRVPDILARSGARLVEVGTTNKTRPADYAAALDAGEAQVLLKVHPSNFRVVGFTQAVSLPELGALARKRGVPLFCDLGSAAPGSPELAEAVAWADVCCFSGDKLLGGPQAGILLGKAEQLGRLRADPSSAPCAPASWPWPPWRPPCWTGGTGRRCRCPPCSPPRREELRRRAEALAEAPPPPPLHGGGDPGEVGGGARPGRACPPGRRPWSRRRRWRPTSAPGGCPSWAASTGEAPAGRAHPPARRRGGIAAALAAWEGGEGMIFCTAGHVDHGKTALVRAPHRGGHRPAGRGAPPGPHHRAGVRPLELPGVGRVSLVDVPGHAQFIPTMLSGCGGLDGALFTVAADEGPMPQTAEHLDILSLLGLERGWSPSPGRIWPPPPPGREVEARTRALTAGTFWREPPGSSSPPSPARGWRRCGPPWRPWPGRHRPRRRAAPGSTWTGSSPWTAAARWSPAPSPAAPPPGDRVQLYPGGQTARVRGLQCHGVPAGGAARRGAGGGEPGGGAPAGRGPGDTLAAPGALALTDRTDVSLRVLPDAPFPCTPEVSSTSTTAPAPWCAAASSWDRTCSALARRGGPSSASPSPPPPPPATGLWRASLSPGHGGRRRAGGSGAPGKGRMRPERLARLAALAGGAAPPGGEESPPPRRLRRPRPPSAEAEGELEALYLGYGLEPPPGRGWSPALPGGSGEARRACRRLKERGVLLELSPAICSTPGPSGRRRPGCAGASAPPPFPWPRPGMPWAVPAGAPCSCWSTGTPPASPAGRGEGRIFSTSA